MPRARIKHGVKLRGLTPQMAIAYVIIKHALHAIGREARITSGSDGTHRAGSLHYQGNALDIGSRDPDGTQWTTPDKMAIAENIREELGPEFDVVVENTHLHVEWQPND